MSIIADFTIPADAFALAHSLEAVPSITANFDRLVAHSSNWIMPFLWVTGEEDELAQFEEAVADDSSVTEFEVTDSFPDACLYKMTWDRDVTHTVDLVLDHEGTILEAVGSGDRWQLKVRFADREQLGLFHAHFKTSGTVHVERLLSPAGPHSGEFNVTAKQRDALVAAYNAGYYEKPRETTATELAERFDLSQQAFSERLNRGVSELIENTLLSG
ncbi:helix-turn-helix domain-containing protein [Halomicrobium urmianum]|uniref:helix-turn-helix domain-containing protein n=1 Tax=Halomicrobium urmianum TaxID=1586233 RepID=UPI001CD9C32F|nr:helix-turn-helix domain-containing protein [Halomicrobium urmianum]